MTSTMTHGVWSNFLLDDDRVFFADALGTLTVLDVQTGAIVARKTNARCGGALWAVDQGILTGSYDRATLLDRRSLEILWQSHECHEMNITRDRLVAYDGNGFVTCRSLDTGDILWSYDLPGALDIRANGDRVLVFHSAVCDGPRRVPAVVLLDLDTGRQLWRKTTPPGIQYLAVYFDGERIYLPAGTYTGKHDPDTTSSEQGRPSARFEKLLVWDLAGTENASIPAPPDLDRSWATIYQPFVLDGKVFSSGAVCACPKDYRVPPIPWKQMMIMEEADGTGRAEFVLNQGEYDRWEMMLAMRDKPVQFAQDQRQFALEDGCLTVTGVREFRTACGKTPGQYVDIELRSSSHCWKGRLLHAWNIEQVWAVAATQERLLLGTSLGHVECIDRASGKSLWIYVFGWAQHKMRETLAVSAESDQDEVLAQAKLGLMLEGSTEAPRPLVIFDPQPDLQTAFKIVSTYAGPRRRGR